MIKTMLWGVVCAVVLGLCFAGLQWLLLIVAVVVEVFRNWRKERHQ